MRLTAAARASVASLVVLGSAAIAALPVVHLHFEMPVHQLRLAWTVTRLLLQL